MALSQARAKRKITGGRYKESYKKKLHELGREPSLTKLAPKRIRAIRVRGGSFKFRALSADVANLYEPKTKKYTQAKIKTISDSPANRHFIRRNIITKGCIIDTELGKARVTSRPGQHGAVNAVLI